MSAFFKYVIFILLSLVACMIVGGVAGSFIDSGTFDFSAAISSSYTLIIGGVLFLLIIVWLLLRATNENKEPLFKSTGKKKKIETKQFFDSKWLTERELDKKYNGTTFKHLGEFSSGMPLKAELRGNDVHVNFKYEDWHALIIGTTGVGKTQCFINPTIQILGKCKDKPGLVVNDMKGELYNYNSEYLRKMGYNVISLDLRDAYKSTRWNPMEKPFTAYQRSLHLYSEVKIHTGGTPESYGLKRIGDVYNNEWYEFEGRAYPTRELLDNDLTALKKQLQDSAYEDLNDIAITLCPQTSTGDGATWERGAKDFVLGVMLAMLEDSAIPELGMTKERFNLFNLYKICNLRDDDPDNQFASLQKYFQGRHQLSNAAQLANPIINNAQTTIRGYMGIVSSNLSSFADEGICFATSGNEMDFEHFTDKPTALFVKVPDEKDTRHAIATMCIVQLYKILIETANKTPKLQLPRKVFFILDEFGNLPKIPKFDSVITVGRSRRISVFMAVQSYTQLNAKYGDVVADTIKSNCNIHYYLGTTDAKTKEDFSLRCGSTSVESTSTTKNKNKDGKNESTSVSTNKTSVRLITVDELGLLKNGEIIVSMFKESAIRSIFTPSWQAAKAGVYDLTPPPEKYIPARFLDTEKVYYDIRLRNKKVFR